VAGVANSAPRDQRTGSGTSVLGDRELHHWEERCRDQAVLRGTTWPEAEARTLVEAILGSLVSNDTRSVVAAARAWAATGSSVSTIVRQMGVLREVLAADDVRAFPDLDDRIMRIMDQATTTATAAALADLEDAALTDALTGVGNRRALDTAAMAALAAADRADHVVSVVVIDLDGLKAINDTDGHAAGDRAIAGIAESLRRALRDSDQLFRIGGDEFVALLPLAPVETVTELMARTSEHDAPAFSWGAATAPGDGTDLDALLAKADTRLYEGRRVSRGANRVGSAPERHAAPAASAAPAGPSDGASVDAAPAPDATAVARARRRRRRVQVVVVVIALSALLGVALHFLTKPNTATPGSRPTTHTGSPGSTGSGPGSGATGSAARGPGAGALGRTPSGADPGGTKTGTSGGAGSRTGAGSGSGGTATGGTGNTKAGGVGTPTTTTTAPLLGNTIPTLPNVGPPSTSLP
jgi:diguanylate cyclase (GGDEF)-like protein